MIGLPTLIISLFISLIFFLWGALTVINSIGKADPRGIKLGFLTISIGMGGIVIIIVIALWLTRM